MRSIQTLPSCHTASQGSSHTGEDDSQGSSKQGSPKMHLHPNVTFRSPSISAALEQVQRHTQVKNQGLVTSYILLEIDCKVLEN